MNHDDVTLIGVFDPDGVDETFCYSVDAPTNLWIGSLCDDGSRMSPQFMASMLNALIEADAFGEGDHAETFNQDGVKLVATVGEEVPADEVGAFQANTDTVRVVMAEVHVVQP